MPYEYRSRQRVEFADTDMAGIVHFSNYFRFMERAEHEFLRSLGITVHDTVSDPPVSWPRVSATCDFRAPLKYEDELEVRLLVREKRTKAIAYEFHFRKCGSPEIVAVGSITVVCVTIDRESGQMSAIAIPQSIDRLIEAAPKELLETHE
jgi:YbgC/YbaW family acyl-CoA thioester hydrolase